MWLVRRLPTISAERYAQVATVALIALALIVLTGAAVRLTDSGLGCPDWPKCYGRTIPPLTFHSTIEFGNRMLTGFVGVVVILASVLAFRRRPYRRHLVVLGALLPIGVIGQAVLGGLVVRHHLAPQLVIGHYLLSMVLLDAAFALYWCSRHDTGERLASTDVVGVWAVRALIPLGQLTVLLGTISTGSGPHAGSVSGDLVKRFHFRGGDTLAWMVTRHGFVAAVYSLSAVAVWFLLRRPDRDDRARRPLTVLCCLLALQGAIGLTQYSLQLPAGLVWVHVAIATLAWIATLWSVGAAGWLAPERERVAAHQPVAASG